jgi:hypothetical protein
MNIPESWRASQEDLFLDKNAARKYLNDRNGKVFL